MAVLAIAACASAPRNAAENPNNALLPGVPVAEARMAVIKTAQRCWLAEPEFAAAKLYQVGSEQIELARPDQSALLTARVWSLDSGSVISLSGPAYTKVREAQAAAAAFGDTPCESY